MHFTSSITCIRACICHSEPGHLCCSEELKLLLPKNRKNGTFFYKFSFLYRVGTTAFYWPRQGKMKGSTFQTFFSTSVAVPYFIDGPFEIPKQMAAEKKTPESKRIHKKV